MKTQLILFALVLTPSAFAANVPSSQKPVSIPAAIAIPEGQVLAFERHAKGVQIYVCSQTKTGDFSWLFVAPQANLYKTSGVFAGTHSIGPIWQALDESSVKGAKVAEAPSPDASIPWLLLKNVENKGEGKFKNVLSIQRLNTVGGVAPDLGTCTQEVLGTISQVPYTADYHFYKNAE